MKYLTLTQVKEQLRLDTTFTLEDAKLTRLANAAENVVANITRRTYNDMIAMYGEIPDDVVSAALLLVEVGYVQGSPVSQQNLSVVPYSFDILLKPYMRLTSDADAGDVTTVVQGSDMKIPFTAELSDGLTLQDVDFTVVVSNNDKKDTTATYQKSDCVTTSDGGYAVMVDTDTLGIGAYLLRLTVQIPDTDYESGYRREVIKIDPHYTVIG